MTMAPTYNSWTFSEFLIFPFCDYGRLRKMHIWFVILIAHCPLELYNYPFGTEELLVRLLLHTPLQISSCNTSVLLKMRHLHTVYRCWTSCWNGDCCRRWGSCTARSSLGSWPLHTCTSWSPWQPQSTPYPWTWQRSEFNHVLCKNVKRQDPINLG